MQDKSMVRSFEALMRRMQPGMTHRQAAYCVALERLAFGEASRGFN